MKYLIILFFVLSIIGVNAQAPNGINYQGIARDGQGAAVVNQAIGLKFDIRQGSATGSVIASDVPSPAVTTNSLGLFNTVIGKSGALNAVNWQTGPYFLEVSIDILGGSAYVSLGVQQMMSVPYAFYSENTKSSYNGTVLNIGSASHTLTQPTFSAGTNVSITAGAGPNYVINAAPTLTISANGASMSISGGNTVALPVTANPIIGGIGITSVTTAGSNYTLNTPVPSYNAVTGVLAFGPNNVPVVPTLTLQAGILRSGPTSNTVVLPAAVTVSATPGGQVTVSGGPTNYAVTVPAPQLTIAGSNLSITGGNTIPLPTVPTIVGQGLANVSGGPAYTVVVNQQPISYVPNTGIFTEGVLTTPIIPTLQLTSGNTILSVGPLSNSVSLTSSGPWKQALNSVSLTTAADNVGIGAPTPPSARLDVEGTNATNMSIIKAINTNPTNTFATIDISTAGDLGLMVATSSSTGTGINVTANNGNAIFAQNSSTSQPAIYARNANPASNSYAGYFVGGFIAQGKSSTNADFALKAQNSLSADLFAVRNDGNVGIGTNTPIYRLEVDHNQQSAHVARIINLHVGGSSSIEFTNNSALNGFQVGYANASYPASWAGLSYLNSTTDLVVATANTERLRVTSSGSVGIGTNNPAADLDVAGFTKLGGTAPAIKVAKFTGTTSNAQGGTTTIAFGAINPAKILSVSVVVHYQNASDLIQPGFTEAPGYEYNWYSTGTTVNVVNKTGNSTNILSKPVRVLITYEQ